MDILQAIILGIVQGLGEFLPISSTAHLILVPHFFGWKDPGLAFDVALHFGTLVAVMGYFRKDLVEILKSAFQFFNAKIWGTSKTYKENSKYNSKFFWLLVVATIPGILAGYFLEVYVEKAFRHPIVIASTLYFVAIILYAADKLLKHRKKIEDMTIRDSIMIGLAQAIAIVPGVSRSGATMTAGLLVGLSREEAARFSFLLSVPIIFGATMAQLPYILDGYFETVPLVLGIISAAISGYLAILFLLKFLQKASFEVFVWYRVLLAITIVIAYLTLG